MKRVLIAGTGPDPYHVMGGCVLAMEKLGVESVLSLEADALEGCCGLILPGGVPDVDPARYGQPLAGSEDVTPQLDEAQFALLDRAVKAGVPVLGICRGNQVLNVYFGGSLIQDLDTADIHKFYLDRDILHPTVCVPGTFAYDLYGPQAVTNTKHHQAIRRLAPDLGVAQLWFDPSLSGQERDSLLRQAREGTLKEGTSRCVIEAVFHKAKPVWGYQWHPELLVYAPLEGTADPLKAFAPFVKALKE